MRLMSTDPVLLNVEGPIATVSINNPAQRGALTYEIMVALRETFETLSERDDVRAIILASEGSYFCSGHNLREMASLDDDGIRAFFTASADLMLAIRRAPQPVIAKVHASTAAAGCQVIAGCDLAVAVDNAQFSVAGPKIGQFPSLPAVAMQRTGLHKSLLRLYLTGEIINAEEALRMGLLSHVVSEESFEAEVQRIAETVASYSGYVISEGLRTFYELDAITDEEQAYRHAAEAVIGITLSPDGREGAQAFLEKRAPNWQHRR